MLVTAFLFLATAAHAITLHEEGLTEFIEKSRKNPSQNFVLKIGATWCQPCQNEKKVLLAHPETNKDPITRAHWEEMTIRDYDDQDLLSLVKDYGLPAVK